MRRTVRSRKNWDHSTSDDTFAGFQVASWSEYARALIGVSLLVGLGEKVMTMLARTLPRRDFHRLTRVWASGAIRFLDLRIEIDGAEHVDPSQAYVVTPLHEGFADVLVLSRLPLHLRYVARDELFEWPRLGRLLGASSQILVRPEDPRPELRRMIDDFRRAFARDESVVVFPQGSILGIEAAFTAGAFRLADLLERPVLPVVITGTHRVWEHPYSDRLRFGQVASMTILPPLEEGKAVAFQREIERTMKRVALSRHDAPPRRFDPRRDGFWDGYRYEIDPDFPDIAQLVDRHRTDHRA